MRQLALHCHLRLPVPPVVLGFNYGAAAYQISATSDNPRLSYSALTIYNLVAVRHVGFERRLISTIPRTPRIPNAPTLLPINVSDFKYVSLFGFETNRGVSNRLELKIFKMDGSARTYGTRINRHV